MSAFSGYLEPRTCHDEDIARLGWTTTGAATWTTRAPTRRRTRAASTRCSPSGWARHRYGERRPLLGIQMVEMPSWSTVVAANRLSDVRTGHRSTVASAAYSAS